MIESFFWRKLLVRNGLARLIPKFRKQLGGCEDAVHWYSDRTLAVPQTELNSPSLFPSVQTPDSIDLALASPRIHVPLGLGRSLHDRTAPHAWGSLELRSELAVQFSLNHGVEHDPASDALILPSARSAFAAAIDAFVNPGDTVVLFDPTSPIFPIGLKHRRARVRWVKTWSDEGTLRFAMDRFAQAIRGAKMLVLAEPNNPTGCVLSPEDIEQIAFWARKQDVLIFQDASFDRWRSRPARARLASLPNARGRVLTCGSFAKSHGLSNANIGWLIGDQHLVAPCAASMLLAGANAAPVCQHLAIQSLRAESCERPDFDARRTMVCERLKGMQLKPWAAEAGCFVWVPTPYGENSERFAQRLLGETGVLVNPGSPFGPSGEAHFRVSFAIDDGRLREALDRIERFVSGEKVQAPVIASLAA